MGYFYFQDSLGNTSHVTDAVGNLLERYLYDAFGQPYFFDAGETPVNVSAQNPTGASNLGIRHLFQGQLWTQETRLNDYRNRVEITTMGVFLQPDPIGFKGDAANIYRFVNNNAVNRTDPMGLTDVNYVGIGTAFDYDLNHYNKNINPSEVISVSAHGSPTELFTTWNDTGKRIPLSIQQVVTDITVRVPGKFSNKDMQIRLYSCRAGDWRAARLEKKLCPAQALANASHHKVQATGAVINPANKSKSISDTCNDLGWYEFSPGANEPARIADPTGWRVVGHNPGPTQGAARTDPRRTFDSYDSTTPAAAAWEQSWGNGGWLAANRLGRL